MDLTVRVRTNLGQYRVSVISTEVSLNEVKQKVERENNIKIITNFSLTPSGEEMIDETFKPQNGDILYCRVEKSSNIINNSNNELKDSKILIKNGEIVQVTESRKTKSSSSSSVKPKKIRAIKETNTTEDIANDLLSAIEGDNDKKSRILRKCFDEALIKQYDETQAIFRLDAGLSNSYEMKKSNNHRLFGLLESFTMTINYHGDKKSSEYTDVVDLIPLPLLKECIKAGYDANKEDHDKEVLKPINISKISPRIFWSVIHLYTSNQPFIQAYKDIFPDMNDFSFLNDRKLILTEKALENKRQLEEKQFKKAQKQEKNFFKQAQ